MEPSLESSTGGDDGSGRPLPEAELCPVGSDPDAEVGGTGVGGLVRDDAEGEEGALLLGAVRDESDGSPPSVERLCPKSRDSDPGDAGREASCAPSAQAAHARRHALSRHRALLMRRLLAGRRAALL